MSPIEEFSAKPLPEKCLYFWTWHETKIEKVKNPMCQQCNFTPPLRFKILCLKGWEGHWSIFKQTQETTLPNGKNLGYSPWGLYSDLGQQGNGLPWMDLPNEPVKEFHAPEIPNVVGVLGLEVFHQCGHRRLELRACCGRPFQVDLGGVPFREQRLDEGVASLPHGLGQVSIEKIIVLVNKSFHLVQHLWAAHETADASHNPGNIPWRSTTQPLLSPSSHPTTPHSSHTPNTELVSKFKFHLSKSQKSSK